MGGLSNRRARSPSSRRTWSSFSSAAPIVSGRCGTQILPTMSSCWSTSDALSCHSSTLPGSAPIAASRARRKHMLPALVLGQAVEVPQELSRSAGWSTHSALGSESRAAVSIARKYSDV